MKNLFKVLGTQSWKLCAIALAAIIGFSLVTCANGTTEQNPLVISGTLESDGLEYRASVRSVNGPLYAELEGDTQTFRAELATDNKTLNGKLKDGAITYELSGEYDASTKVFSMQAPSSFMIFSIAGTLNTANAIDTDSTRASVKVKDNVGEWTSIDLTVAASDQTVDTTVNANMDDVTYIPEYCRGTFTNQIGGDLSYTVTKNSITMFDGDNPPQDFTVVEITNANDTPADEDGPWHLIIRATYYPYGGDSVDYTGKFYISKKFDAKLEAAIGSAPITDVLWGEGETTPLSTAVSTLPDEIKMFVTPYCGTSVDVSDEGIYPANEYSPLFTGASATANAKASTTLKAKSGFTLALK